MKFIKKHRIFWITWITFILVSLLYVPRVFAINAQDMPRYDLRDNINIEVKDQKNTTQCWISTMSTVFETNLNLKNGINEKISSRHVDYGTSTSFFNIDSIKNRYNRQANTGGTAEMVLSYMTNGTGPVLEETMPFSETFGNIDIIKYNENKPNYQLEDWVQIPSIYKKNENGNTIYLNEEGVKYTSEEVSNIRNKIKEHIITNGAIYAPTHVTEWDKFYNFETNSYYLSPENARDGDHAVAIIGWDDNYSKDNFKGIKPIGNGAYLVQGSWGEDSALNNGTYYISYEDYLVERELFGVVNIDSIDYDKIYQYDNLGRNQYLKGSFFNTICGANVFSRDKSKVEYLNSIGISTYCNMEYEIYVNSQDGELSSQKMQKIETTQEILSPGYHKIDFKEPIKLTGDKFAVLVVYIGVDEEICITTQSGSSNLYANTEVGPGKSYIGYFVDFMSDVNNQFKNTAICIKAFTELEKISTDGVITSKVYSIGESKTIERIKVGTTISQFKQNINLEGKYNVQKDSKEITDQNQPVSTGMNIKLDDNSEYDLIVTCDINGDGRLSVVDMVRLKRHLVKLMELNEIEAKAADSNYDNRISTTDLSKIKLKLVGLEV